MNFRISAFAIYAALVAGCASPPNKAPVPSGPSPRLSFLIDAAPGKYGELHMAVHEPAPGQPNASEFSLRFLKQQPSERWLPALAVCTQNYEPIGPTYCLSIWIDKKGEFVSATQREHRGKNQGSLERRTFPLAIDPSSEIRIRLEGVGETVKFSVNGRELFSTPEFQSGGRIKFVCSSAICSVNLR
jgi:hypothetical protein